MYQKSRIDTIMDIMQKSGYVTVKYLCSVLNYSTATINRDLNLLEQQGFLTRSYGGAEITKSHSVPLAFRYDKMKTEKQRICKVAAELINDGDTVFIDATTTTQSLGKWLIFKKDITVITNNMALVSYLSEYNINVICLGGEVSESPYFLLGEQTIQNAKRFHADKLFFSVEKITESGEFCSYYSALISTMAERSEQVILLSDHEKLVKNVEYAFNDFSCVDFVITDCELAEKTVKLYPNVTFINASK